MDPKAGRIKRGEGALIGNAGEYYVVAELLKRGYIAAMAPRNAPGFDILVTNKEKTVKIRVKTKSGDCKVWQWSSQNRRPIFKFLDENKNSDDFTILVHMTEEIKGMEFYILHTALINEWLVSDFKEYISIVGPRGPRSPRNPKRTLDRIKSQTRLVEYLNNWDILWE